MVTKAEIKLVRSLSDRAARRAEGLFVAEGAKLVGEIERSSMQIEQIFRVGDNVSSTEMARLSHLRTPTDHLALVRIPLRDKQELMGGLILMLDGVQDPGNLGTIIRLADWFGVRQICCSEGSADCWNPKVVQATMGAITRVEVHYGALEETLERHSERAVYGTFLEGESIYHADAIDPCADAFVVMGSEGRGVSSQIAQRVTRKLFIPPYPTDNLAPESLNVATATGIVLSEFRRRISL